MKSWFQLRARERGRRAFLLGLRGCARRYVFARGAQGRHVPLLRSRAADIYREIGTLSDGAEARLRSGLALLEAGERSEGAAEMERALAFYRAVGATYFVRQGEAALADAGLEIPA